MKITHEEELKELFEKYKGKLLWNPDEETAIVVISITKRNDEPGLNANFANGTYVNLGNCEVSDFGIIHRLTVD
jgi:hypothetical protein